MRKLENLYEKAARWRNYLSILERQMNHITHDDERVRKLHQMAAVWEEHFEKNEKAIECYESVLEIDDKDERAYQSGAAVPPGKEMERVHRVLYRHVYIKHDPKDRVRCSSRLRRCSRSISTSRAGD
jgi:hypothetical protein